jgi:hypothetical protein
MRAWLGEEPELKFIAFILLLPLAGLNLFLIYAGIVSAVNPSPWFGSALGIVLLLAGGMGLAVQLLLMISAASSPRAAGIWVLVIGVVAGVAGVLMGFLSSPIGILVILAPFPGAMVLMYAGKRADRPLGPPAPFTRHDRTGDGGERSAR